MSARFDFKKLDLEGAVVFERKPIGDKRGFLQRIYCLNEYEELDGFGQVVQMNHTLTEQKGTLRGMHYQTGSAAEGKIVSCLKGSVFDVIIDLRKDSDTYLQWYGTELSESNFKSLYVPRGFAHGFQTLTNDCELLYLHDNFYSADDETGVNATDPAFSINWPEPITVQSDRDSNFNRISSEDKVNIQ